ncbi:hypothetical protein F5X68DRAFT_193912 [Plectosphaerella plurivora]|uniref:Uncharacterized protein n=1 Tax=Plectosphaerella plurivora TaxID=936078 RepID=A0A9P9A5C3_9PEZI|nr:hypothetical protein F5X68DRAFT_193912 [Plectosphaerella plurivora]
MEVLFEDDRRDGVCPPPDYNKPGSTDLKVQLALSLVLGVFAFVTFSILRPRWSTLYAARKRRLDPLIGLPALPDSFFGWIPGLYKVTEEQVLASAGLDAFVVRSSALVLGVDQSDVQQFLAFFKMAARILAIMAFFAYAVLLPINMHVSEPYKPDKPKPSTQYNKPKHSWENSDNTILWTWLVFTYFFTALTIYIMNKETFRVIRIRQDYLGTQSTITDRTFRLSGLPSSLKTEDAIKELIEKLEIGQVESVNLCRNWKELDALVVERANILTKLEETWSVYIGKQTATSALVRRLRRSRDVEYQDNPDEEGDRAPDESDGLLSPNRTPQLPDRERPTITLRYGLLSLRTKKLDAIHYYEEKLRRLDQKIQNARDDKPEAASTAFVTMDSIAACQMAIQARIDPRPGNLLTKPAPSPSDVVWANTYTPRGVRRLRSWIVTVFVAVLTLLWVSVFVFLASLLSICNLRKLFPSTVDALEQIPVVKALIETALPTLVASLLNVLVPYLYEYLSYQQGMISKGDVELSIISKNFFFSFFNLFLVFTVSSTAISAVTIVDRLQEWLGDTKGFALLVASKIIEMRIFYTSFILLQGVGLFPFRLLQIGSVLLYPIYRMGAKTPRDFAQIMEPALFSYGFYLPTASLIFILCLVYSVLLKGYLILTVGLAYFVLGYFTYKYQLLYAMDQPQHATGGAWRLICNRIVLGLFTFQLIMASELALYSAFVQALLILPLILLTSWYNHYFKRRFVPLTRFIALRSIRNDQHLISDESDESAVSPEDFEGPRPTQGLLRRGSTIDEDKEKGLKFINPSLTMRLQQPWIYQDPPAANLSDSESQSQLDDISAIPEQPLNPEGSDSSLSLGDTHIWRENGENRS